MIDHGLGSRIGIVCLIVTLCMSGCGSPAPVPLQPTAALPPAASQTPAPTAAPPTSPPPAAPTQAPTEPAPGAEPAVSPRPDGVLPILTGPSISPDSWSPDGKWLAYWTRTPEEMACSEMCPPGTLHFLAPATSQTCAYPLKPDPYPELAWQADNQALVFADGSARVGTPCQDDFREATPEETGRADGSLSPDGRYRAQTETVGASQGIEHLVTTLTDVVTGDGKNWVEWQIQQRLGFLGLGGEWLPDGSFLIHETNDRGPLLVPVGKEPAAVASAWFGLDQPASQAPAGVTWRASVKPVAGTDSYHAVLYAVGTESAFPPVRLYHSETGQAEELPFQYLWNTPFSPEGRRLFLRYQSESSPQYREVDPFGAPFQPVPGPASPVYAWSQDGARIAFMTPENIIALDFPQGTPVGSWQAAGYLLYPSAWSPDQSTLAARGTLPDGKGDGLFLIDTGVSSAPPTPRAAPLKLPGSLTVEEYALKDRPTIEPLTFEPVQGRMGEVLKKRAFLRDVDLQLYYANNPRLRPFGYRLVPETFPPENGTAWTLYKGDQVVLDQVADFGPVTVNADGSDFLFSVERYNVSRGMYLVRKDSIEQGKGDPYTPRFGLLGPDLLESAQSFTGTGNLARGTVQLTRGGKPFYSASTGLPSPIPSLWGVWTFGEHWALEVLDNHPAGSASADTFLPPPGQVILDGVSLNQQYGYEESFGFQLLRGRSFYFFRKDGKIGAVYAGQTVLLGYDSLPHYGCCSAGELNPSRSGSMIWFFAEREGAWYYVEIGDYH